MASQPIFVLNCGSSSVKFSLLDPDAGTRLLDGSIDAIGSSRPSRLTATREGGRPIADEDLGRCSFAAAFDALAPLIKGLAVAPRAVGHRVVHGGERFTAATRIDEGVLKGIREVTHLAPLHNPANLDGIEAAQRHFPALPQVAVFDTAFHQSMPEEAYRYAVEPAWQAKGIRKYGFHGISVRFVAERAAELGLGSKVVVAHLGNGCSVSAVRDGQSVDTSMGMTPLGGVVMGTRSGDLDPGAVLYAMQTLKLDPNTTLASLNKRAGLKALSGGESDMRELRRRAAEGDRQARLAIDVFVRRVAQAIAAAAVSLGGLDAICFAGGIGENASAIRRSICEALAFVGLKLGEGETLTTPDSPVQAVVVPTDEALMIARETAAVLAAA